MMEVMGQEQLIQLFVSTSLAFGKYVLFGALAVLLCYLSHPAWVRGLKHK